jgi:hypothetical protein
MSAPGITPNLYNDDGLQVLNIISLLIFDAKLKRSTFESVTVQIHDCHATVQKTTICKKYTKTLNLYELTTTH